MGVLEEQLVERAKVIGSSWLIHARLLYNGIVGINRAIGDSTEFRVGDTVLQLNGHRVACQFSVYYMTGLVEGKLGLGWMREKDPNFTPMYVESYALRMALREAPGPYYSNTLSNILDDPSLMNDVDVALFYPLSQRLVTSMMQSAMFMDRKPDSISMDWVKQKLKA